MAYTVHGSRGNDRGGECLCLSSNPTLNERSPKILALPTLFPLFSPYLSAAIPAGMLSSSLAMANMLMVIPTAAAPIPNLRAKMGRTGERAVWQALQGGKGFKGWRGWIE